MPRTVVACALNRVIMLRYRQYTLTLQAYSQLPYSIVSIFFVFLRSLLATRCESVMCHLRFCTPCCHLINYQCLTGSDITQKSHVRVVYRHGSDTDTFLDDHVDTDKDSFMSELKQLFTSQYGTLRVYE